MSSLGGKQSALKPVWFELLGLAAMVGASVWAAIETEPPYPVHYNLEGEVDRRGGALEALVVIPLVFAVAWWMLLLFVRRLYRAKGREIPVLVRIPLASMLFLATGGTLSIVFETSRREAGNQAMALFTLVVGGFALLRSPRHDQGGVAGALAAATCCAIALLMAAQPWAPVLLLMPAWILLAVRTEARTSGIDRHA